VTAVLEARELTGWGRTAPTLARVVSTADVDKIARVVREADERGVIARGLGRSYGDPAQNAGGTVVDMTALNTIHSVDQDTPSVTVDAGVSLDALLRHVVGYGLWVPVLPGTRQVTVGGAIGFDIHGGNHHTQGSFSDHVLSMDLLTADGEIRTLTPDGPESELFWATAAGMGLTGIILKATIKLDRVETAYFLADVERASNFDELLERLRHNDENYTYSKTWFDSVTTGPRMGRGFLLRGSLAKLRDLPPKLRDQALTFDAPNLGTVPDIFPNGMLNKVTASLLNEFYYRKTTPKTGVVQNITEFYHLLDIASDWNRAYGPAGFLQYQFVVPFGQETVLRRSVETISGSGHLSCLNVLKRFGEGNRAPLSFPTPGWTLAVDMPVRPGLHELCEELDRMVLAAGGRVYLGKDSRISREMVQHMYPHIDEWRGIRAAVDPDGIFRSDMSRRLAL
jgi:decaprenylphospho-beta-D-ribofuranose 2-oxidase